MSSRFGGRWSRLRQCGVVLFTMLQLSFGGLPATLWAQPPPDDAAPGVGAEMVVTPDGDKQAVIPPGQEELLIEMLGRGMALPGPCTLSGAEAQHVTIRSHYACPAGEVIIELSHPDAAPATATRTERFALVVRSGTAPAGFTDALVARIRSREAPFEWKWIGRDASPVATGWPIFLLAVIAVAGLALVVRTLRRRREQRHEP